MSALRGRQGFDDRYPAMFQPGGEDVPADSHWPVQVPVARTTKTPASPAAPPLDPPDTDENDELPGQPGSEIATTVKGPWLIWRVPAMVGALLLGLGVLAPSIPWWISMLGDDPNAEFAIQMWMYGLAQLAGPLIGVGLGILVTLLFLFAQQHPTRREGLRRLFTIVALAVMATGLFALFANFLIPPERHEVVGADEGTTEYYFSQPNIVTALMMMGFPVVLVALLMFASLAATHNFSIMRMNCVGLFLLAAAAFSYFAQQLFPDVPWIIEGTGGGSQGVPGWPSLLPQLTPVLVAAGVLVIAVAVLFPVLTSACAKMGNPPKLGQTAVLDGGVDHPGEHAVEQGGVHVQPQL